MRLATLSTSRTGPKIGDCPCCFGALEGVKRALSEVSRALADPLPLSARSQVRPALEAIRVSGRDVMAGLKGALGGLLPVPDLAAFRAAVVGLDEAIEVSAADVPARERVILGRLRVALGGLGDALTTLTMELDDAGHQAGRRTDPQFRCEFAGEGRTFADTTIEDGITVHSAAAGAAPGPHRLRMAEGLGR